VSVQVESIDVYGIEKRLKEDKTLKDVWDYVKALKHLCEIQKQTNNKAISKIKEMALKLKEYENIKIC
jgi:hypothetical protein